MDARAELINEVLKTDVTKQQADALDVANLPQELKDKITKRFYELAAKYPKMKRHRIMRKAGEEFHVKFNFVK